ncbi:MAG: MerR family transcriptional regulator [Chloroflexi bacterium]|nr:MerR family transcriptional regulator [Chloroflexota bacterium]
MVQKRQASPRWRAPSPDPWPEAAPPLPTAPTRPLRRREGGAGRTEPSIQVEGVYIISVAARLLEMHPQTLRKYERAGLVGPSRTLGMRRLYSEQDILRLRLIKHLVEDVHMNLAGVEFVLGVFHRLLEARSLLATLQEEQTIADSLAQEFQRLLEILDFTGEQLV